MLGENGGDDLWVSFSFFWEAADMEEMKTGKKGGMGIRILSQYLREMRGWSIASSDKTLQKSKYRALESPLRSLR